MHVKNTWFPLALFIAPDLKRRKVGDTGRVGKPEVTTGDQQDERGQHMSSVRVIVSLLKSLIADLGPELPCRSLLNSPD